MPTPASLDRDEDLEVLDRYLMVGLACMAFLIVAFGAYRATEPERRAAALAAMNEERIELGQEAYGLHCDACHGPAGRGGRSAPTLAADEFLGQVSDEQLHWLIAGGIPGTAMAGYHIDRGGPFTDQDVGHIVAYLRSLEDTAVSVPGWREGELAPEPPESAEPEEESEESGAELRARRSEEGAPAQAQRAASNFALHCASCHGPGAQGTTVAQAIAPPGARLGEERLLDVIAHGTENELMRGFGSAAGGPLSAEEIQELARWLAAGAP